MTNDSKELADRIEGADGPSRELFEAAYRAIVGNHPAAEYRQPNGERGTRFLRLLDAEAWLDAAMTLVPEKNRCFDLCRSTMGVDMGGRNWRALVGHYRNKSLGRTPALALCAAALRAHGDSK